jgi:hypothetical protein
VNPPRLAPDVTAATVTARPGLQAVPGRPGRRAHEIVHAVLETALIMTARGPFRGVTLEPGAALCAADGAPFPPPPAGLFEPAITCPHCTLTARAENVTITGGAL